ncbi:MAG: phage tail protein [Candidatus Eremiobacteraeota bacterium]|nr:phage tail protein [Candidatus Eremiobacteraeota bacterium]
MIFGLYGPVIFAREAGVMHGFEEKQSAHFVEHPIHLQKPILEFCGPRLAEVSFEMEFLTGLTTAPVAGIVLLNALLKTARAYPLIVGGRPIGSFLSPLFVLTEVGAAHHWYSAGGGIQSATIRVALKEYVSLGF